MAKKKEKLVFIRGGNFKDGSRFEKGDMLPANISKSELETLFELNAIEKISENEETDEVTE